MEADDLKALMAALVKRVRLTDAKSRVVAFDVPTKDALIAEGLHPVGVRKLLLAPWWNEMIEEVLETPSFCDENEAPETVLRYAQDVVVEYLRKRFTL